MSTNKVFASQQESVNNAVWVLPETLRELAQDGDAELVLDLIRAFKDDTAIRLRDLRRAALGGDRSTLRVQAHTVKGSARQMGAIALAEVCERLELATLAVPVSEVIACADHAEAEFTKACRAMLSYSSQDASGSAGNRFV